MSNSAIRYIYKIMLKLGGSASQNGDYITTWFDYGGCTYQNIFLINREEWCIEDYDEQVVPYAYK